MRDWKVQVVLNDTLGYMDICDFCKMEFDYVFIDKNITYSTLTNGKY